METKYQSIKRKEKREEELFSMYTKAVAEVTAYAFTSTEMPYDAKMTSGSTHFICETKVREDKDMAYFEKYGPFLELKKIEGMYAQKQKIKEERGIDVEMLYFNFASDGLQIYKLEQPWDYNFSWRLLPKDNYDPTVKVQKLVSTLKRPIEILKKS